MSSENKPSLVKKSENALEKLEDMDSRLQAIESALPNILQSVNTAFQNTHQRVQSLYDLMDAAVELLGQDKMAAIVERNKIKNEELANVEIQKQLDEAVAAGKTKTVDTISDQSLVVLEETKADGTIVAPGKFYHSFSRLKPEYQPKFLGAKIGDLVDLGDSGTAKVLAIYESVQTPEAQAT